MVAAVRALASNATAAAAPAAAITLGRLAIVARNGGAVQPGLVALLSAEWQAIRALALALSADDKVVRAACRLCGAALRHCEAASAELLDAVAQLSMALLMGPAGTPRPCVARPLIAAIDRFIGGIAEPPAPLMHGLKAWMDGTLGALTRCLVAPTVPSGDGSQAVPLDLTDDDDEALEMTCAVLSACVRSGHA
eukprot:2751981-Prymnesium_polylepis.1